MNLLLVALVSVILATGVFNTEPKDSEVNKKTEIIVNESSETKPAEEEARSIKSGLIELSVENKFLGKSKLANFFKTN